MLRKKQGIIFSRILAEFFIVFPFKLKSAQYMSKVFSLFAEYLSKVFSLFAGFLSDIMEEFELKFSFAEAEFRIVFSFSILSVWFSFGVFA